MGSGLSAASTVEEARALGHTEEEIEAYLASNSLADSIAGKAEIPGRGAKRRRVCCVHLSPPASPREQIALDSDDSFNDGFILGSSSISWGGIELKPKEGEHTGCVSSDDESLRAVSPDCEWGWFEDLSPRIDDEQSQDGGAWMPVSKTPEEAKRRIALESLSRLHLLTLPELFECIALSFLRRFASPIALVQFLDDDRRWFNGPSAKLGLPGARPKEPEVSDFCQRAMDVFVESEGGEPIYCAGSLAEHPRFSTLPVVAGPPHMSFYAGAVLHMKGKGGEKVVIGTVCIVDCAGPGAPVGRQSLDGAEARDLIRFARDASNLLEVAIRAQA